MGGLEKFQPANTSERKEESKSLEGEMAKYIEEKLSAIKDAGIKVSIEKDDHISRDETDSFLVTVSVEKPSGSFTIMINDIDGAYTAVLGQLVQIKDIALKIPSEIMADL